MNQPTQTALRGVAIFRFTTIASLILAFVLFISGTGSVLPRTIAFMMWMALCAFHCFRIIGDLMSRQNIKAQRFQNTLDAIVANAGDAQTAQRSFLTMQFIAGGLKLVIPVVLFLAFR